MIRLVLLVTAASLAASQDSSTSAPAVAIVRSAADGPNPDGSYSWSYETENGIKAEERGELRTVMAHGADNADGQADNADGGQAVSAQGSYSYTAPDGSLVELSYVADENGFRPQGAHLPVAPPVPEAIQRALQWIAEHPEPEQSREQ